VYPQVFGKYVLEKELSRGGMARVLLATLRGAGGFEKRLVVKQIRDELAYDQQFIRRFVEEAKTTVALSHPNIVPVYELGVEAGTYFLAMELVEGLSIAELLRERREDGTKRVLTPEEGAYLGMEVCRALEYAHRRMKVVHRDITPRNVMLDEEGQVKLIDFGIAAPAKVAGHEILGSPGHMPPEQVAGKELGPPTDIFALAVLLMEAWTGVAPFRRATPEECDAAMREKHPRPSDFDPRLAPLDDAIGRALKLDPKDRQQEASDLGRALRSFLAGMDPHDLARALGDRVRDMRNGTSMPAPSLRGGGGADSMRAVQPSQQDIGTKTFAARDEALRWSHPPAEEVEGTAAEPVASTRKLNDSAHLAIAEAREARKEAAKKADPAMSIPTPLMVEPVDLDKLETIATRPLETPSRVSTPPESSKRKRSVAPFVAIALVALVGIVVWRAKSTTTTATDSPTNNPTPSTTVSAPIPPSTVASASSKNVPPTPSIAVPPPSSLAVVTANPPPSVAHPTLSTAPGPTTSSSAIVPGRASVSFLGDPGTKVSIDGMSRGACPVRLNLEPGQHEVRFVFEPTGESRGERFSVKANERVTVRADFTGATPTVRIQH
jgi:eukaryotic-like serine/threonine-protein kinase